MRQPIRSVLVTGGAGFVGAAVSRRLRAEGLAVRVIDDLSRGRPDRLDGWGVELAVADVRSTSATRGAVAGVDAVVHLAWVRPDGSAHGERIAHDVNVTGTLNLLAAARDAGVPRFILGSSAAVYGGKSSYLLHEDAATLPVGMEGAQKIAAESYVRLFGARDGLATTILRMFSVYGPEQEDGLAARLSGAALAGEPAILTGDGSQTRDLVFVEDVAVAVAAALTAPGAAGRVLNIASGEAVAVRTVAGMIADLVGGAPHPRFVAAPPGEARDVRASVAAAISTLGFRAKVRLREGLAACLGMCELPAPPLPPRVSPTPAGFPEGSDSKLAATPVPSQPPAPGVLFADKPLSWTVTDEAEISIGFGGDSVEEWAR